VNLEGDILLSRGVDGRWYLVKVPECDEVGDQTIGRPEGYESHSEGAIWRTRFRQIQALQEAPENSLV
jgi:hypothetical protein